MKIFHHRKTILSVGISPSVKLCQRVPYEDPSNTDDGDTQDQRNGVDVEETVKNDPVKGSIHLIFSFFGGFACAGSPHRTRPSSPASPSSPWTAEAGGRCNWGSVRISTFFVWFVCCRNWGFKHYFYRIKAVPLDSLTDLDSTIPRAFQEFFSPSLCSMKGPPKKRAKGPFEEMMIV